MPSRNFTSKVVDPKGARREIPCKECNKETWHEVMTRVETHDSDDSAHVDIWRTYDTVRCQGCDAISFVDGSKFSEDVEFNDFDDPYIPEKISIYPNRLLGQASVEHSYDIPRGIRDVHKETYDALCNGSRILSGIGIRAIIDGVCMDQGIPGRDLFKKVDRLHAAGIVSCESADVLHNLRFMGNKSAHEIKSHPEDELALGLEITGHLLATVYVIPNKAKKIPRRPPGK